MKPRNIIIRILAALGWLILIYFVSNILIGAIIGGIAGSGTTSYEAGRAAGYQASVAFFQNYGLFVLIGQIALFALLAFLGKLPGTSKYKA